MRDELLNETLFRSLPHARAVLEAWGHDYNEERPYCKLGWMTPRAYAGALSGEVGRDAALRWGSAPRPLAIDKTESSNQSRTLVIPGRKKGVTSVDTNLAEQAEPERFATGDHYGVPGRSVLLFALRPEASS